MENLLELEKVKKRAENLDNLYIVEAIMQFDNLAIDYTERKQRLLEQPKEDNIEKLIKRLDARFDTYVVAYILFLDFFLTDNHDYTVEELTIVENVFEHFNLTNLDTHRSENRRQVYRIIENEVLQKEIKDYIEDELTNYLDGEDEHGHFASLLYNKVMFEMLYVTSSELEYQSIFRPRVATYSIRLDEADYRLNEIIRAYHSNEFITPSINDLYKRFLVKHYEEILKQDPGKVRKIERDYEDYLQKTK